MRGITDTPYPGYSFLWPLNNNELKEHLWIVLTDPDDQGRVLAVSVSTKAGDKSFLLQPAEHPFIRANCYVRFHVTSLMAVEKIGAEIRRGSLRKYPEDAPGALVEKLRRWTAQSCFTPPAIKKYLRRAMGE